MRFLCSQGVLVGHLVVFFGFQSQYFISMASYCVLMFFVLSGFLISHSLHYKIAHQPGYNFYSYFKDRFFRIFPPYLAALILVFLVDLIGFSITGQYFSWTIYTANLLINSLQLQEFPLATWLNEKYMIEFFRFHYLGTDLPLWTISIEWWLYMFYGFVVFHFLSKEKTSVTRIAVLLFLSIVPFYYLFVSARMEKGLTLYWFLGILLTSTNFNLFQNKRAVFNLSIVIIITGIFGFASFGPSSSILIFFFGLFLLTQSDDANKLSVHARIKRIGESLSGYSYSLYLIHYSLIYFATTVFHFEKNIQNFLVLFIVNNLIAYIFAEIFEKKSKHWRLLYENYRSRTN